MLHRGFAPSARDAHVGRGLHLPQFFSLLEHGLSQELQALSDGSIKILTSNPAAQEVDGRSSFI